MPKELTMPLLSPSMTEGVIVRWLKKEGERVASGEILAEVETDKATMELEAFEEGVLQKILISEGQRAPVGTPIAILAEEDEVPAEPTPSPKAEESSAGELQGEAVSLASTPPQSPSAAPRVRASPLARKLATASGIELSSLQGTGPGGRIVQRDVLAALEGKKEIPAAGEPESVTVSSMRARIAQRLLESKTKIPHFYLAGEVNAEPIEELRQKLNGLLDRQGQPFKYTVNDFLAKAVVEAARRVPEINASWGEEKILRFSEVDLAVAVALPEGLITPVVRGAQRKSLRELAESLRELVARARERKLKPEEYTGGTLTLSNLGMYGVDWFLGIINPPQAVLVAAGAIARKPVVGDEDKIVIGKRLPITLSCDHRVVDGATAARYLAELRAVLEEPLWLLSSP